MNGSPFCTAGRSDALSALSSLRGEGGPAQAVAPGRRAHVVDGVAEARGLPAPDLVVAQGAEAEGVHQRVALVRAVEVDVPADGGHADAVAVVRDAGDHSAQEPPASRASPARRSAASW